MNKGQGIKQSLSAAFSRMLPKNKQDAVGACIWAWSYYGYGTLNMPYCS